MDTNGDRCVACGAELGVGRFCLNCGHPIGAAPALVEHQPIAPPVQAADPTPIAPTNPPELSDPPELSGPPELPAAPDPSDSPAPIDEWDPARDLLPYEEVDVPDEPPIQGRAWIAWVAGAVLLIGLVVVLIRVLGTDEAATEDTRETTTDSTSQPSGAAAAEGSEGASQTQGTDDPLGVGPVVRLVRGATFDVPGTAPPTTDFDGNLVAYEADQMGDGSPATTWRTAGDATGATITITLSQPSVVTGVGLVNGYAKKVAGVDWYPHNRRVLSVTWGFDDGSSVEQTFAERPGMQQVTVAPVETTTITLTLTSVTPPGSGNLGRDYTAISEVSVMGRRAG